MINSFLPGEADLPEVPLWRCMDAHSIDFRMSMQAAFAAADQPHAIGSAVIPLRNAQPLIPSLKAPLELGGAERNWMNVYHAFDTHLHLPGRPEPSAPIRSIYGKVEVRKGERPEQTRDQIGQELTEILGPPERPGVAWWYFGAGAVKVFIIRENDPPSIRIEINPGWRFPVEPEMRRTITSPVCLIADADRLGSQGPLTYFDRLPFSDMPLPGLWRTQDGQILIDVRYTTRLRVVPVSEVMCVSGSHMRKAKGSGWVNIDLQVQTPTGVDTIPVRYSPWGDNKLSEAENIGQQLARDLGVAYKSNVDNIPYDA